MEKWLEPIITILRQKGYSDDQIADIAEELANTAFHLQFTNAMAAFTEEDVALIDACETEEAAQAKIRELYELRTGKNAEEELRQFLINLATEFVKEHHE